MSKRFGRQQKRQLRAELQAANDKTQLVEGRLRQSQSRASILVDLVKRIEEMYPNSLVIPPKEYYSSECDHRDVIALEDYSTVASWPAPDAMAVKDLFISTEKAYRMHTELESMSLLNDCRHVVRVNAMGEKAYYATTRSLDYLEAHAGRIAFELIQHIRKAKHAA